MPIEIQPETEALIFDLDGTLLDSMEIHRIAWREASATFGVTLSDEEFNRLGGLTTKQIVAALADARGTPLDATEVSLHKAQAYVRHLDLVQPFPDMAALAERYHGSHRLAIGTNEDLGVATIALRTSGLFHLFEVLVAGDEVESPKPEPDVFLECAARLRVDPARCEVFEDSDHGIRAAEAAGMRVTDVRIRRA